MSEQEWSADNFTLTPIGYVDMRPWKKNGDFSINQFKMIMVRGLYSQYDLFELCWGSLVDEHKRWPDNAWGYVTDERDQHSVTRDCYVYAFACAVYLNRRDKIDPVKLPFKLYSPKVWAWVRALKGKRNWYLFWNRLAPGNKPWYVQELNRYMMNAYCELQNVKP